jgi:hypothetical protein
MQAQVVSQGGDRQTHPAFSAHGPSSEYLAPQRQAIGSTGGAQATVGIAVAMDAGHESGPETRHGLHVTLGAVQFGTPSEGSAD